MSNPIRFDSLLVRHLAGELDARLHGARVRAIRLDAHSRRAALELDRGALTLDLHPRRGYVRVAAIAPAAPRVLRLRGRSVLRGVTAAPDERRFTLELAGTGAAPDRPREVVVELLTNQWNVIVVDRGGRILAVLWARETGGRALRPGASYRPPPALSRAGLAAPVSLEDWLQGLVPVPRSERPRRLIAELAWTSTINAHAILGEAAAGDAAARPIAPELEVPSLAAAYQRYRDLLFRAAPAPVVLALAGGSQPYPMALPGVASEPFPALLDAFAAAAAGAGALDAVTGDAGAPARGVAPETLERLRAHLARVEARCGRLRAELASAAADAAELRRKADVLLAHLHEIDRGLPRIELPDFDGGRLAIDLDPSRSPAKNAARLYDQARRRKLAAERVPALLDRAVDRARELRELLELAVRGEVGEAELAEAAGLGEAHPETAYPGRPRAAVGGRTPPADALPYRRYRTSGGLEVRVGRSGAANDELTFRHSSPDDIWLHARDAAGAHVVLRWPRPDAHPPLADLQQAAALAALHSRARTSGAVPVDWTRRKYVRKPRKAPPGRVVPDRVRTLFVEPAAAAGLDPEDTG